MGGACAARASRPPVVWAAGRAARVGPVRKVDKLASVVGMVFIFPECAYGKFLLFKGPGCRTESPAGQERLKEQVVDVMMQVAITVISSAFGKMWEAKLELTENSFEVRARPSTPIVGCRAGLLSRRCAELALVGVRPALLFRCWA